MKIIFNYCQKFIIHVALSHKRASNANYKHQDNNTMHPSDIVLNRKQKLFKTANVGREIWSNRLFDIDDLVFSLN